MFYELLEDGTIGRSTLSEKVAKSLGLTLTTDKEIVYGYDGKRYFKGEEPLPPAPTKEEISALREQAYIKEVDVLHAQKDRKTILGSWTEEDEANYIAEVKRRSEDIASRYPYPDEV